MDFKTIGDRIRYLRKDILNLTLKEMSSALNISLPNLGNVETGRINATQRMISDICRVYNVDPVWLETGEGKMIPVNEKTLTVSDRIRLVRKTLNLSQPEFGRRVGVSRDVINNIERNDGRAVEPKAIFIEHLCHVYNVNSDWLLNGDGKMFLHNDTIQTVSDRIRLVRKSLEMTQQEFADSLGVNRSIIKNYELSIVSPTNIFIEHLCMKHGINKDWILTGTGDMLSHESSDPAVGIPQRIRELRKHLNMTQTEFGESLGVSREVINTYEHGKVLPPHTVTELLHLKHNVNPAWLNTGVGEIFCPIDSTCESAPGEIPFNESSLKLLIHSPDLIDRSITFLQTIRMISSMDQYEKNLIVAFLKEEDTK